MFFSGAGSLFHTEIAFASILGGHYNFFLSGLYTLAARRAFGPRIPHFLAVFSAGPGRYYKHTRVEGVAGTR